MLPLWSAKLSLVLPVPQHVCSLYLSAGVPKTVQVPSWATTVLFSATALTDFYVAYGATASLPVSDITDGTGLELNPTARRIAGVSSISLVSPNGGAVTLSFYG